MDRHEIRRRKIGNALRSAGLLATLAALLVVPAFLLGGTLLGLLAAGGLAGALMLTPAVSPALVARLFRAREIREHEAPGMMAAVRALTQRAGLPRPPRLYLLPTLAPQAFTTGGPNDAGIVLSQGLLRRLTPFEITGVLAHEMSHVRNRDTTLMLFAGVAGRLTGLLSSLAILLIWISLPLALLGAVTLEPLTLLVLIVAPHLSTVVAMALSRAREFEADLDAARLMRDPGPLASALVKLESSGRSLLARFLWPTPSVPPLLRSHPPTAERVRRLMALRAGSPTGFATTSRVA